MLQLFLFFLVIPTLLCAVPIDIVYTWVDGSDPNWRAIYNCFAGKQSDFATDAVDACRFAAQDELKYSLRSICKYAPFFNHIYIITMNQKPSWLKPHPQVTIIDHKTIFPKAEDLPTFNSQAIESNLHRIPGLSEYFIYFNDDVFLGRSVTPGDFFTEEGKVKVLFESMLSPSGPRNPEKYETTYRISWRNTNWVLDQRYRVERRYRLCHAPFAYRKSFFEFSEEMFPEVFASNASHRFRDVRDFNLINGFLQYHWTYENKAVNGQMSNQMITIRDDPMLPKTQRAIDELKACIPHTFCIQDNVTNNGVQSRALLHDFLEGLYPDPAPWELAEQ